jgi:hypothetical protein
MNLSATVCGVPSFAATTVIFALMALALWQMAPPGQFSFRNR